MRCFISLALGLLALEVALARNLQQQEFDSAQSVNREIGCSESAECVTCHSSEECAQNTMCCADSGDIIRQTAVNNRVSEAYPEGSRCARNSDCEGNLKCCTMTCAINCEDSQAEQPSL